MLEICCGGYYDAVQAALGGAGRIELNCGLHLGGLTPTVSVLELVKGRCDLRVIAMVRPRGGGFCYGEEDYEVMLRECEDLLRHGADGIAFGFLKEDASIDRERTARMISIIHRCGKEAVFHRAFDCTLNPYESMETLIGLGADRVLTSGLKPRAVEGMALLADLQSSYGSRIEILAGSGVNASNARLIMEETGITQVHSSCKDWLPDPTTASKRPGGVTYGFAGPPHENSYDVVSAELVHRLLESLE